MSIPIPLAVRVATATQDIHLTRWLRDLQFREVATGGFASATFSIDRPLGVMPQELEYFAAVYIYDNTGTTVWEGRLEDLGIESGDQGQVWRISALGPSTHASDRNVPLIYVDTSWDKWIKARSASGEQQNTQVSTGDDPGGSGDAALVLSFPTGMTVPTNGACTAYYLCLDASEQNLAVFDYSWDAGLTSASWEIRGFSSGTNVVRTQSASTGGGGTSTALVGSGAFSFGDHRPIVQFRWTGAASGTGTSDIVWASIMNICVRATTWTKAGSEESSGYSSADKTILASTVVADLLGRLLDQYDGANAEIDTTSYAITQLAYYDGVTPREVLDDLMEFEPGYRWGAYESSSGGHRFEWKAWPSTVRYEAAVHDGFDSPASATDVWNAVRVYYEDSLGQTVSVRSTSTVDALVDADLTREAKLDLVGTGSVANATQTGEQFLAEHERPAASGTLRVSRPIIDLVDGRWVQPWQIRAGELIRVRDVQPRVDALTATGRDGISVFKVASREYNTADATATLELDEYTLSTARALATVKKQAKRGKARRR
jgi:hypothetical protein